MGVFAFFDKIRRRSVLMERMMRTLDVKERFADLPNRGEVMRRASARCLGCGKVEACSTWLDGHDHAVEAPAYCRNHDLFARLKRQTETA